MKWLSRGWARDPGQDPAAEGAQPAAPPAAAPSPQKTPAASAQSPAPAKPAVARAAPKVSVVIPCYNGEDFLEWTLESVRRQTFEDFECLVVNDASSDGTAAIITRFERADKRFQGILHRANGGLSASRNTGLRVARGEYIAFLDADDLMMEDSLALRVAALDHAPEEKCIGTYCGSVSIEETVATPPPSEPFRQKLIDFLTASAQCPFNANQPMLKRAPLTRMGGFNEQLKQAEDYDLWARLLRAGYYFAPTHHRAVTYRSRSSSMIRSAPLQHLEISMSLAGSAYYPLPDSARYCASPDFLHRPIQDYKFQVDLSNRILSFAGMALGAGYDVQALAQRLSEYSPDLATFVSRHRDLRQHISLGIKRQIGVDPRSTEAPPEEAAKFQGLMAELLTSIAEHDRPGAMHEGEPPAPRPGDYFFDQTYARVNWPGLHREVDIAFIPHKDYHVWTISMLAPALERAGIKFIVVDISQHYRDERVRAAAERYGVPLVGYGNFVLGDHQLKAIVTFNDWDPIVRSILLEARAAGVETAAIVEGVQDYWDADTRQDRHAYRTVDTVFLPGDFDRKYFAESSQTLVSLGVPRVQEIRRRPPAQPNARVALINTNFSYGVLAEARDAWVDQAVEACREAGLTPVISRHPADLGDHHPDLVTSDDFYTACAGAGIVIQRFGSGVLEALAMGVPTVYFNPHGERNDKFLNDAPAVPVVNSQAALVEHLKATDAWRKDQATWAGFLDRHSGLLDADIPEVFAGAMARIVAQTTGKPALRERLIKLDQRWGAFLKLPALRKAVLGVEPHRDPDLIIARADARSRASSRRFGGQPVMVLGRGQDLGQELSPAYLVTVGADEPVSSASVRSLLKTASGLRRILVSDSADQTTGAGDKAFDLSRYGPILWPDLEMDGLPSAAVALLWAQVLGFRSVGLAGEIDAQDDDRDRLEAVLAQVREDGMNVFHVA